MSTSPQILSGEGVVVIERAGRWPRLDLGEVVAHRDLLWFLAWRDVHVRYKQTLLGAAWIVLQPALSLAIFSVIFGRILGVPSAGTPYPVFALAALLPWNFFASSLARIATSLVANSRLITKVYFPRLCVPLAAVLAGLVDLAVSFVLLVALMLVYGIPPRLTLLALPLLVLLAVVTALGVGLWLAALNVRFRDVGYVVPFLVQIWMYATPVIYGSGMLPEKLRLLFALNPMTGVVEGFRWAILGPGAAAVSVTSTMLACSVGLSVTALVSGLAFFRITERTFADYV